MNIYEKLNYKYNDKWSLTNPSVVINDSNGRMALYVVLKVDDRSFIGCSSIDIDFSKDVTERLLEKAVISAFKKIKISEKVGL